MTTHLKQANWFSSFMLVLSLTILVSSCSKDSQETTDEYDPSRSKTILEEAYGSGTRQIADIYLPANRNENTKVVIMLHGGSWAEGNKTDLNEVIKSIRTQWPEVAIINMNYRLADNTPANYHPGQMNDINAILDYIASKRSLWKVSDKMAITGVSAGGHLGLLYSYAYNAANRVKAVVSIVGPTDFSDPTYTNNPIFQLVASNLLGKTWTQDADLHRSVSPALRVTASSPPTFMAYGALDPVVPITNAATLRSKLQASNITHTYVEYPNETHEFSNAAIANLLPLVITFLKESY
jgi:acetyl esterase/lipase